MEESGSLLLRGLLSLSQLGAEGGEFGFEVSLGGLLRLFSLGGAGVLLVVLGVDHALALDSLSPSGHLLAEGGYAQNLPASVTVTLAEGHKALEEHEDGAGLVPVLHAIGTEAGTDSLSQIIEGRVGASRQLFFVQNDSLVSVVGQGLELGGGLFVGLGRIGLALGGRDFGLGGFGLSRLHGLDGVLGVVEVECRHLDRGVLGGGGVDGGVVLLVLHDGIPFQKSCVLMLSASCHHQSADFYRESISPPPFVDGGVNTGFPETWLHTANASHLPHRRTLVGLSAQFVHTGHATLRYRAIVRAYLPFRQTFRGLPTVRGIRSVKRGGVGHLNPCRPVPRPARIPAYSPVSACRFCLSVWACTSSRQKPPIHDNECTAASEADVNA